MSGAELQRFVLRSQVISLYRNFIRAARRLPGNVQGEVLPQSSHDAVQLMSGAAGGA